MSTNPSSPTASPFDASGLSTASGSGEALRQLVLEVFRLNGALLRHGAALTAPVGQTQARWQVIGAVAEATRTVTPNARRMGMSRRSVQRDADLLVKDDILRFDPNPDHARSPLLRLTPHGEEVETQLAAVGDDWAASIATGMVGRDVAHAVDVVRAQGPRHVLVTSVLHDEVPDGHLEVVAVSDEGAWAVTTPLLPITPNGCGDVTAALYLAHLHETGSPAEALTRTTGTVFAVLEATLASGHREIRLVDAQDAIASPPATFTARRLR